MRVRVFVRMAVIMMLVIVVMLVLVTVTVFVRMLILLVRMRRAFMDAELHPFNILPLLPLEVHVEVAERDLRELPLERGGLHTQIAERADGHVAADAGKTIEKKDLHNREDEHLAARAARRGKNDDIFLREKRRRAAAARD